MEAANATAHCCAECGIAGGDSIKTCGSCFLVRYCNPTCQRSHWSTHKIECKRRTAELRDEALFKDPPAKEDCPICFLPMPVRLLSCISLPPATISSVPINEYAIAHAELANNVETEHYFECCGKSICRGCVFSFATTGLLGQCPYCNADRKGKTDEEKVGEMMKRVEANDASSVCELGGYFNHGLGGLEQDCVKAMELFARATKLGSSKAHCFLADIYHSGGDFKKTLFHFEAAAMAGCEVSRCNLGVLEANAGNKERAIKHFRIAASAGCFRAMSTLLIVFKQGHVNRDAIDATLTAYNNSCAEMRSKARDLFIQIKLVEEEEKSLELLN